MAELDLLSLSNKELYELQSKTGDELKTLLEFSKTCNDDLQKKETNKKMNDCLFLLKRIKKVPELKKYSHMKKSMEDFLK